MKTVFKIEENKVTTEALIELILINQRALFYILTRCQGLQMRDDAIDMLRVSMSVTEATLDAIQGRPGREKVAI